MLAINCEWFHCDCYFSLLLSRFHSEYLYLFSITCIAGGNRTCFCASITHVLLSLVCFYFRHRQVLKVFTFLERAGVWKTKRGQRMSSLLRQQQYLYDCDKKARAFFRHRTRNKTSGAGKGYLRDSTMKRLCQIRQRMKQKKETAYKPSKHHLGLSRVRFGTKNVRLKGGYAVSEVRITSYRLDDL